MITAELSNYSYYHTPAVTLIVKSQDSPDGATVRNKVIKPGVNRHIQYRPTLALHDACQKLYKYILQFSRYSAKCRVASFILAQCHVLVMTRYIEISIISNSIAIYRVESNPQTIEFFDISRYLKIIAIFLKRRIVDVYVFRFVIAHLVLCQFFYLRIIYKIQISNRYHRYFANVKSISNRI